MKNNGWGAGEKVRFRRSRHWALASERAGARKLGGIKNRKEWPVEDEDEIGGRRSVQNFSKFGGAGGAFFEKKRAKKFSQNFDPNFEKFFFRNFWTEKKRREFFEKNYKVPGERKQCTRSVLGGGFGGREATG